MLHLVLFFVFGRMGGMCVFVVLVVLFGVYPRVCSKFSIYSISLIMFCFLCEEAA